MKRLRVGSILGERWARDTKVLFLGHKAHVNDSDQPRGSSLGHTLHSLFLREPGLNAWG